MSHPPSRPYPPNSSFITLVHDITSHPFFPVIIKKVFDVCGSNAFDGSTVLPRLLELERDAAALQNFAETHGSCAAEQQWDSTDVFMSVVVATLNRIRTNTVNPENLPDLHRTISTCRSSFNAWTDPRYVGATDEHRITGIHGTHLIPQTEGIRGPDMAGQRYDQFTQRPDGIQRRSGIQKPANPTRKPLSDKAKATLEKWFQDHIQEPYPSKTQKQELATTCAISLSTVNNWFGNKRMRMKRKVLQAKSQGDEDKSENALAPKSKWNAVVLSQMASSAGRKMLEDATGVSMPQENVTSEKEEHSLQTRQPVGPSGPGRPEKNAKQHNAKRTT